MANARKASFAGTSLTLSVSSDASAERLFAGLGEGGKVGMPLANLLFPLDLGWSTIDLASLGMIIVMTDTSHSSQGR